MKNETEEKEDLKEKLESLREELCLIQVKKNLILIFYFYDLIFENHETSVKIQAL